MKHLNHNFKKYAKDLQDFNLDNLQFQEDYLETIDQSKEGILETCEIETLDFYNIVCSWSALTLNGSIELLVSVCVNGVYSKYFSYGEWSLYKDNYYYNQDDTYAHMSVDEVLIKDNLNATGFKIKVIIKNDCKLKLIHAALKIKDYTYPVNRTFPDTLDYNVDKLNQNIVPEIGNQICSPTTITMLLKYKGFNFQKFDEFEHRYVAGLVKDPGHNSPTYGNWVYNTSVSGALGVNSYVCFVYSFNELKSLLLNGPVGVSIRGDTGIYKTNGHLMLVRGYKTVDNVTYVICNDPNINERFGEGMFVYVEYPLEIFEKVFRGVCYVLE